MAPAPLPAILTKPSDPHPFVARLKVRKLLDISYASERNVFDQVTLAWCLVALGREADAAAICEAIAHNVDFTVRDRYETVWGPAYSGVVLGLWLAQKRGDAERAQELEAIARRVPGKVAKPRQRAEAIRKEARERMADARATALRDRAFALLQAHPLEWLTAELTMPLTDVPRDELEALLAEAIDCVREIVARGR